jgi:hypothetical protein
MLDTGPTRGNVAKLAVYQHSSGMVTVAPPLP